MGGFSFETYSRSYVDESSLLSDIRKPDLMQVKLILHIENIGDDTKNGIKKISDR
jgi:hypothetical protein